MAQVRFFSLVYSMMHNLALFSLDFTFHRPSMNFSRLWSFIVATHMSIHIKVDWLMVWNSFPYIGIIDPN